MAKRKRKLNLNEAPSYPSDYQAKQYLKDAIKKDPLVYPLNTWFKRIAHSETVECLMTAGKDNHFFVFAYPSAGITIKQPEDIENIQLQEAWLLEYLVKYDTLNTLVKLSRDGDLTWYEARQRYKP